MLIDGGHMRVDHCFRIISVLILSTMLSGCMASMASRGLLPDISARQPPPVDLGPEIVLSKSGANQLGYKYTHGVKSLITADGRVHLFGANEKNQIHHVEVSGNEVVLREIVGVVEGSPQGQMLDAIEHPIGGLRVLASDKQFIRLASDKTWREIKGNLCEKFITANGNLFCAFIAKGKEIGAPKRKDWTVGWFFLIPVAFWSNVTADKLVLAQESTKGWIIRAVLDPETELTARSGFMIGADLERSFNFLYGASGENRAFIVAAAGLSGAGWAWDTSPLELRYASVPYDRILSRDKDNDIQAGETGKNLIPWESVQGLAVAPIAYGGRLFGGMVIPLDGHFFFSRTPGELGGLIWYTSMSEEYGGISDAAWYYAKIREGKWAPHVDIVAVKDIPEGALWHEIFPPAIKNDSKGNTHLLLTSYKRFQFSCKAHYFLKTGGGWSAPLIIDSNAEFVVIGSLSVDATGKAFAVLDTFTTKTQGKLIGRWITPKK